MLHTDKAHRLRIVTCKRDRQAIAQKLGQFGEASSKDVREWMAQRIYEAMDEARDDLYDENARDVAKAVGPSY